ncbi:MAG: hypothetical protein GX799_00055 [Crenarchaeota archaeon]|nr:hypothetical protein [Thermoproteota archaeon]
MIPKQASRLAEAPFRCFQPLFGVDVSYKYIECLYGDSGVKLALHSLLVMLRY